ncbi:MAG: hypothetical protein ACXV8O_00155 [Methylobacter sp.]
MLKKNVNMILVVSSVAIAGCSSAILKTSSIPREVPNAKSEDINRVGSIYFLPKALIPINIKFNDKSDGGGDTKPSATSSAQVNNTITINGENSKVATDKKANKCEDKKPIFDFKINLGDMKYFPDTTQAYFLEHNENWLFDDNITIEVGENQLLQTIDSSAKDETGPAMVKIADLAGTAAKMATPLSPLTLRQGEFKALIGKLPKKAKPQQAEALTKIKYVCTIPDSKKNVGDVWFDLGQKNTFDELSVKDINQRLFDAHLPIEIAAKPLVKNEDIDRLQNLPNLNKTTPNNDFIAPDLTNDGCDSWHGCISKGVLVRSPIPYLITVTVKKDIDDSNRETYKNGYFTSRFYKEYDSSKDDSKNIVDDVKTCLSEFYVNENTQMAMVMAPNDGPITSVDDSRASFVTKKTTLTIANGMLKKINVDQPSQFLGFISIPVDMAKAIAAIPGSILSMKIQNTQDQASLYKAQVDLLTQLQALQKMQDPKATTSP